MALDTDFILSLADGLTLRRARLLEILQMVYFKTNELGKNLIWTAIYYKI